MKGFILFILCLILGTLGHKRFPAPKAKSQAAPSYTTSYFSNYVDHFDLYSPVQTYQQRYLWNDTFWQGSNYPNTDCPGPILFYTGNESPVTDYWDNSGFMTEVLAPNLHGLLLFAEHRYFGVSLPYGNSSFDNGKINHLSPEQALADYAHFLHIYKTEINPKAKNCPVVAFGGSYGGLLTAWFRKKYPHVVIGGLAASAPLGFEGTGKSPYLFMDACQETYRQADPNCPNFILSGSADLLSKIKTASGRTEVSQAFSLCSPLQSVQDGEALLSYIQGALVDMSMLDYPYATDYGINFPAWPVNTTCFRMLDSPKKTALERIAYGLQVFYNSTGTRSCLDTQKDLPDWGTGLGWPYLACSEVILPNAQRGMWLPSTSWDSKAYSAGCYQQFGIHSRFYTALERWGGYDFSGVENIIFSNGLLDPWHSEGILKSPTKSLTAIVIPEAAHHLDLRGPHPADPSYVRDARKQEEQIITGWVNDFFQQ